MVLFCKNGLEGALEHPFRASMQLSILPHAKLLLSIINFSKRKTEIFSHRSSKKWNRLLELLDERDGPFDVESLIGLTAEEVRSLKPEIPNHERRYIRRYIQCFDWLTGFFVNKSH